MKSMAFYARRALRLGTLLFLLVLAWVMLAGGVRQLVRPLTVGQSIETVLQLVGGVLTLLVVLTCFRGRRWARSVRRIWSLTLAAVVGLSALVWGPPMPLIALLFAVLALVVAQGVSRVLPAARPG